MIPFMTYYILTPRDHTIVAHWDTEDEVDAARAKAGTGRFYVCAPSGAVVGAYRRRRNDVCELISHLKYSRFTWQPQKWQDELEKYNKNQK